MTKARSRTAHHEKTFVIDGKFLRDEAKEAVRSYFSPFAGIYAAATGRKILIVRDEEGHWRQHHKKGKAA